MCAELLRGRSCQVNDIVCVTWPDGPCSAARVLAYDPRSPSPLQLRIAYSVRSADGRAGPELATVVNPGDVALISAHNLSEVLLRLLDPTNLKKLADGGVKQALPPPAPLQPPPACSSGTFAV